ncbi:MAG: hypothetical protein ACK5MY_02520 [Jhaorihella sp.]
MGEVKQFKGTYVPSPEAVDPAVVDQLEYLLGEARAGRLIGIATVSVYAGDLTGITNVGTTLGRSTLGALAELQMLITRASLADTLGEGIG